MCTSVVECQDLIRLSAAGNTTHEDGFYTRLTSFSFQPFQREPIPFQLGWVGRAGSLLSAPSVSFHLFSPFTSPLSGGRGLLFCSLLFIPSPLTLIGYICHLHRRDTLIYFQSVCHVDVQLTSTCIWHR